MKISLSHLLGIAVLGAALSAPASAAVILTDDFNFTGNLTANGWTAHSGAATQPIDTIAGLTYAGYVGSGVGNAANLDNTGEDVNRLFTTPVTSGSVYAAFLINVPSSTVTEGYFFHYGQSDAGPVFNTSLFKAKTYLATDGTGDYELGLTYQSNAPIPAPNKTNLNLTFGTTYLVVLRYDIVAALTTDDTVSLYVFTSGVPGSAPGSPTVGPIASGSDAGTDFTANVGGIALRQYNANERIIIDGLRVADTWEDAVGVTSVSDWTVMD